MKQKLLPKFGSFRENPYICRQKGDTIMKTLKAKGGKPIPADENSLDALVEKK